MVERTEFAETRFEYAPVRGSRAGGTPIRTRKEWRRIQVPKKRAQAKMEEEMTRTLFGAPPPPTTLDLRPKSRRPWSIFDGINVA